jgi:succinate dehydrogenase/fumarate reductase flavoprotein subunit
VTQSTEFPETYDVVVVGSGAGGLTAAVLAAAYGLSVLVIEKASQLGGTTALSGGGAWIPNNHLMHAVGQEDSEAESLTYMRHILGNGFDDAFARAYVRSGPAMLRELEQLSEVRFYPIPLSDYSPATEGAKLARTLIATEYDGRELGRMIRDVRNPLPGFAAFGSFQTDPQHIARLTSVFRSREGFVFTMKRMAGFLRDVLRHGKGTHLANGGALVGRLLKSAIDRGVEIRLQTALDQLVVEQGRVTGLVARTKRGSVRIGARHAVVLATGGFGANEAMRRLYMPLADDHLSAQPDENVGDGICLGETAGGHIASPNAANGVWAPCSAHRDAQGRIRSVYPHFGPDRAKPGFVIVDAQGKRFANEAAPYQTFVNVMNTHGIRRAWFIGDTRALRTYGMGVAMPAPLPYKHLVRDGYLIRAATIGDLAKRIGVPERALVETIAEFNRHAADGRDPAFGKGTNIYDNALGDFNHAPNPNVGPLTVAPYYAVMLQPGDCSSTLGLETTIDAEVIDAAGAPIPGLFAVGLDQNSLMKGTYPGGGSSIGPAMTFAYRAARKIAGREDLAHA